MLTLVATMVIVVQHAVLGDGGFRFGHSRCSPFKSTREGRSPLRTLRVERQVVFQLFLRDWDSKFP